MSEYNEIGRELAIEAKIAEWKKLPVYLASSSEYRANSLKELGFEKISSLPAPEEVETKISEDKAAAPYGKIYNKRAAPLSAHVAHAKVDYLMEHNDIPDDAFVCAVDTMPTIFQHRERNHDDPNDGWRTIEHLDKPKDEQDAKEMIFKILTNIATEYKRYIEVFVKILPEEFRTDPMVTFTQRIGYPPKNIRINSGLAIRFPNSKEVETSFTEITLEPQSVYDIVEGKSDLTVEELADQLFQSMKDQGIAPEKITGAIDYGNEKVQEILKLHKLTYGDNYDDQDEYAGFPTDLFVNCLKYEAEKSI